MANQVKCTRCSKPLENANVPFMVHESDMARSERSNRRLWLAVILLIVAMLASNLAWIIYEFQYTDVDIDQEVEQQAEEGNNVFIGGDSYGKAESENAR